MKQIWRIIRVTGSLWRYYLVISVLTILLSGLNLLIPFLTGLAVDEIAGSAQADVSYLVLLALIIFAADLGANLTSNVSGYFGDRMASKVQHILSLNYYKHILSLSQTYFDTELTGKIINRLNRSIYQIAMFMNILSNNFLQFIFSTVFALVIVAFYSWQVALLFLALFPIFGFLTVKSSPKWRAWQKKKNKSLDISSGRFGEAVGEIRAVKSFNQEKHEVRFFRGYLDRYVRLTKPQSRYWHKWDTWRRLALNFIFLGVYLYIFIQAAQGGLSAGDAVALILYGMQIRIPLFTISFLVEQTQRAMADSDEYFKAMDEQPQVVDKPGAKDLQVAEGEVMFDNVSFRYDAEQPVLKNIDFQLKPGSKTALVGESGEGKTTITNLLLRLYDVQSGRITIDGQDISDVKQASLRGQIAVVFQEPTLFSGTIRENIAYAKPRASMEEVEAAAKAANAHDFISKFDKGYSSQIGERGLKLSGGQKQRIAIARAILKDAPLLILDEATSSLDTRSEQLVQQALERLMKGRTTLIIAHRLSTIQSVDQIVTLKNGQVDEIGSPATLAQSGGIYAELLELQNMHTESSEKRIKAYGLQDG